MSKEKKEVFLLFVLIITLFLCVSNIVIAVNSNIFIDMTIVGELEYESGGMYQSFSWEVIIIIFSSLIIACTILSYLFNIGKFNKKVQSILLYINIVLVLICVFLYVICLCLIYSSLLDLSNMDSGTASNEINLLKDMAGLLNNVGFRDSLLVLMISSICSIIMPIISLTIKINDKNEKLTEDSEKLETNINYDMKEAINKLKQELELEDLKKEYAVLYRKLHSDENFDNENKSDMTRF